MAQSDVAVAQLLRHLDAANNANIAIVPKQDELTVYLTVNSAFFAKKQDVFRYLYLPETIGVTRALAHFGRSFAAVNLEFLVKIGKNSGKTGLLIDLPYWEILLIDEGDRQGQPEEVLGATRSR